MELKQLEYLVASVECGSYCKASEVLYTSQANISKVISRLEGELGYKLLERSRTGVCPTAEGILLYYKAKEILEKAEKITSKSGFTSGNYLNVVSVFDAEFLCYFTGFIKKRQLEKTKSVFLMANTEEVIDYVENGRAEIGFIYTDRLHINSLKYLLDKKQLELKKIANADLLMSVGKNNPLFDSKQIMIDQLRGQEFVFFGNEPLSNKSYYINMLIKKLGLEESIERAVLTNSDSYLKSIIEETDRSYLHYSFQPQHYQGRAIRNLRIKHINNEAIWCYIKKKKSELGSLNRDLINYLYGALE